MKYIMDFEITLDDFLKTDGFQDGGLMSFGSRLEPLAIECLQAALADYFFQGILVRGYDPGSHHNNVRLEFYDGLGGRFHYHANGVFRWTLKPTLSRAQFETVLNNARARFEAALSEPKQKKRFDAEEVL